MAETASIQRRSALSGVIKNGEFGAPDFRGPGVALTERHPLSMVQVEGRTTTSEALREALESTLGLQVPAAPNTSQGDGRPRVLWTGPNRWLVVEPEARDLDGSLRDALSGSGGAVLDLSHGRASIRLSGRDARNVLMKGAPLDWHPRAFTPGMCAQTATFHLPALIDCRETDTFDLYVARGYAQSFWESVTQAAAEYGYRVG